MGKKTGIVLTAILCLGGGLCIWKWDTWFSNPPEQPYTTPATPDRIILSFGEDAKTERYISWRCDTVERDGRVEYGIITDSSNTENTTFRTIEAESAIVTSRAGKSAFYRVMLDGLCPGNTYRYRVTNDTLTSEWYTFQMPKDNDTLDFLFLGDVQDAGMAYSEKWFQQLHTNYPNTDFWAFVGDIIERPTDAYWSYWFGTMDGITQTTPILAATGNHEYLKGLPKTLDSRWTYSFVNPVNGPRGFEGQTYYIDFPNLRYIVIDTDGIQGPLSLWRHYRWLEEILKSNPKLWTVVMMHHAVHSVRAGRDNYYIRWTFRPLFEKYSAQLILQGHDHGYSRITTKTKTTTSTIPVYIVSSSSPKTYPIGFSPIHDRLGANLQLYQHITIKKDTLHYRSYTYTQELYDDLFITSDGQVIDNARNIPECLDFPFGNSSKEQKKSVSYNRQKSERLKTRTK